MAFTLALSFDILFFKVRSCELALRDEVILGVDSLLEEGLVTGATFGVSGAFANEKLDELVGVLGVVGSFEVGVFGASFGGVSPVVFKLAVGCVTSLRNMRSLLRRFHSSSRNVDDSFSSD